MSEWTPSPSTRRAPARPAGDAARRRAACCGRAGRTGGPLARHTPCTSASSRSISAARAGTRVYYSGGHTLAEAWSRGRSRCRGCGLARGRAARAGDAVRLGLTGRATVYTITDRRLVMRYGLAVPITFQPAVRARSRRASLRGFSDGTGDMAIRWRCTEHIGCRSSSCGRMPGPGGSASAPSRCCAASRRRARRPHPGRARLAGSAAMPVTAGHGPRLAAGRLPASASRRWPEAVNEHTRCAEIPEMPSRPRWGPLIAAALTLAVFACWLAPACGCPGKDPTAQPGTPLVGAASCTSRTSRDGAVRITDAGPGNRVVEHRSPEQGFLRGTLRGFARRAEGATDIGLGAPFRLTGWTDGRLTLEDPATGRRTTWKRSGRQRGGVRPAADPAGERTARR